MFRSYWKLPAAQSTEENCVAKRGNIVPLPGRDVFAMAWYQGGHTLVDFTDSANPREIAFFDRGPIDVPNPAGLTLGGFFATYFYNGRTFGSEIARCLDVFRYTPTADLTASEIAVLEAVELAELNPQLQSQIVHAPSFALVRLHLDQLVRAGAIDAKKQAQVEKFIDRADQFAQGLQRKAAKAQLLAAAKQLGGAQYTALREALLELGDAL